MSVSDGMRTGTSFDWRHEGPEEAKREWFKYLYRAGEAITDEDAFQAGFLKGAQWAVRATSALSPAVMAMVSFVDWVHEHELEVGE